MCAVCSFVLVFFWCTSPLVTKVILPSPGPAHLLVDEKHGYLPIVIIVHVHHYHNHDYHHHHHHLPIGSTPSTDIKLTIGNNVINHMSRCLYT